ncbi:FAD/FMN-containing dehydrogenase [Rhizobiales bacterium GAS113]|nr:FAD/FMN-containing dehydrogenase [Rhizobiales bacterium GAS113]
MIELSGWGRYPVVATELHSPSSPEQLRALLPKLDDHVARGNGRAYGDAAIGLRNTVSTGHLDRMRSFDAATGRLTVESGVSLSDIIAAFLPRGFFPPVVPGTKFVSVGGMIAADVHGKNHHKEGGFGTHVETLKLALGDGEVVTCSATENPELFAATVGGMGLTGTILEASFRLRCVETAWIRQRTLIADNLEAAMRILESEDASTYSVAWIDCLARGATLGRSLIYLGEHATAADLTAAANRALFPKARGRRLAVPFDLPGFTLNSLSVAAFNEIYFRRGSARAGGAEIIPCDPYFFPLDGLLEWNRIYGRRGFVQHQCVIPTAQAARTLAEIIGRIARRREGSFLAVLKKLGAGSGLMSFPMPGYTLALDFPVRPGLFAFLDEIDRLVTEAGGRVYLAKDARQSRRTFEAGYPALAEFQAVRQGAARSSNIRSHLSERLGI